MFLLLEVAHDLSRLFPVTALELDSSAGSLAPSTRSNAGTTNLGIMSELCC